MLIPLVGRSHLLRSDLYSSDLDTFRFQSTSGIYNKNSVFMDHALGIKKNLLLLATPARAKINAWFFKTGKGQYGEGDVFIGVTVPRVRGVVKEVVLDISFTEIQKLLKDPIHEVRLCALLILIKIFQKVKTKKQKKRLFDFYIAHTKYINNWDLVDVSAHIVVGEYISTYMTHKERFSFVNQYVASKNLWENRIIIIATFYEIKNKKEKLLLYVAKKFLTHKHDLIHKALGWMLREVGKHLGENVLRAFLDEHISKIPRTTLRYAIECFPESVRKQYLAKK